MPVTVVLEQLDVTVAIIANHNSDLGPLILALLTAQLDFYSLLVINFVSGLKVTPFVDLN